MLFSLCYYASFTCSTLLQNDTNHICVCNERSWCDKLYKWVMNKDSMFNCYVITVCIKLATFIQCKTCYVYLVCVRNRYVIVCLITIAKFYDVWNLNAWLLRSKHGFVGHKCNIGQLFSFVSLTLCFYLTPPHILKILLTLQVLSLRYINYYVCV